MQDKDFEDRGFNVAVDFKDYVYNQDHHPPWIGKKQWEGIVFLESQRINFNGITTSIKKNARQWKEYFKCSSPFLSTIPEKNLRGFFIKNVLNYIFSKYLMNYITHIYMY